MRLFLFLFLLARAVSADVVAVVNGAPIAAADVDAPIASKIFALEQQLYTLRRGSLDNLVAQRVLADEAKRRGVSVDEVKNALSTVQVKIAADAIEREYRENVSAFSGMSGDEARQRIRIDLETKERMRAYRDAVTALVAAASVDVRLREPRVQLTESLEGLPSLGPADAAVTIIAFSDYQCPYCKESGSVVRELLAMFPDDVRLVHRHLPSRGHAQAFAAARAAACAAPAGRFWQFHDALFAAKSLDDSAIRAAAARAGLQSPQYAACVASDSSAEAVMHDVEAAQRLGVTGTPTLIVNGAVIPGAVDLRTLKEVVLRELSGTRLSKHNH